MQAILGSIVGGLLAITGGLLVGISADRRQRRRWQHDNQLKVGSELLGALQLEVRRLRDLASIEDKTSSTAIGATDAFHEATMRWNTAMYAALIATPAASSDLLFSIDREVDRLSGVANGRRLSTSEFRAERRHLGNLMAEYVNLARGTSGLRPLELKSAWSWDTDFRNDELG